MCLSEGFALTAVNCELDFLVFVEPISNGRFFENRAVREVELDGLSTLDCLVHRVVIFGQCQVRRIITNPI